MSRDYPRIGHQRLIKPQRGQKKPLKTPPCAACAQPSTHRVDVEVNWFRGDDEVFNACSDHKGDAQALLAAPRKGPAA
ncbi:hypothetical protein [Hydrogenophaga sp.]|uniref:hypothetical protein n=1 Tax=Hydrogenophaga sp. TaxID=1904254 RepID=UPI003F70E1F4